MSKSRTIVRRTSRSTFGTLENLEQRRMFAVGLGTGAAALALPVLNNTGGTTSAISLNQPGRTLPTTAPDYAGGTTGTALTVDLPAMVRTSRRDYLPSSSDIDMFKVRLNKGDFLAVDIDPASGNALSSTLAIVNAAGAAQTVTSTSIEPDTGASSSDPALGFWAPATGDYFVKVGTTSTAYNPFRSYDMHLQRVGMDYGASDMKLAESGDFHVWMSQDGTKLNFAGPSGYGFSLRGTWTAKQSKGNFLTYAAQGTMYLSTPYLNSAIGEIALQPGSNGFSVTTKAFAAWRPLGELVKTTGEFGFSLAPIANTVKQAIGLDLSSVGVMNKWTIMTGEQVRDHFQAMKIEQVLDGVPYMVYQGGNVGQVSAQMGDVRLTKGNLTSTVMIAEPADPYLYVHYNTFAAGASVKGRIPVNNTLGPSSASASISITGSESFERLQKYFGHVFAHADVPLTGLPATVHGNVTIDLDANNDGKILGGSANAANLFSSSAAWSQLASDVNIGVKGTVDLGYKIGSYNVAVQVGEAEVLYSGPQRGVWFDGRQHTPDAWAGTPLASFKTDLAAETRVYGHVFADGRMSVSSSSIYTVYALGSDVLKADATVRIVSQGTVASTVISASGELHTPIGEASINGTIQLNGNYSFTGNVNVDIGGGSNYIRGNASVSFAKTGSTLRFRAAGELTARFRLSDVRATGKAEGWIDLTYGSSGLKYDVGLYFKGIVEGYEGLFTKDWHELGSLEAGFHLTNNKLELHSSWADFSMALP